MYYPASFRYGLLFLFCLSCGTGRAQGLDLMGVVVLHNGLAETGRVVPVVGASLRAPQARATTSDREGRFTMQFKEVPPGAQVQVTVNATGLIPLDPDALRRITVGAQASVRVVMTSPERLTAAQLEYHGVAVGELERRHQQELDRLRDAQRSLADRLSEFERSGHQHAEDLSEAMQVLEIEREAALEQIMDLASRFARVDLDVASERYRRALTAFRSGRISETMALLDTAVLDGELRIAVTDRERGERLVAAADKAIRDVLDAYELRVDMLQTTLRYADALTALERITMICEEQTEQCDLERRIHLASERAYVHKLMGRFDLGLQWIDQAIQLRSRSTDSLSDDRISLLTTKSQLLRDRGDYEPALEEARAALDLAYGKAEVDASSRLLARFSLIEALDEMGHYDEVLLQATELVEQARSADPPDIRFEARGWMTLANAYVQKGRLDSALSMGERSLELLKTIDKPGAPELIAALNNVGLYHADLWNSERALELLTEARNQQLLSSPEDHPTVLMIDANRATCWKDLEKWEEAGSLLADVVERMRALLGGVHPRLASALVSLGGVYIQQERTIDALRVLSEARSITIDALGPEHPFLMNIHNSIAKTYLWSGRPDSALVHYDLALRVVGLNDSLPNADEALLRKNKATAYLDMEEYPNAIREGRAAIAAYAVSFGEEHREMGTARTVLGIALFKDGQLDEGDLEFERALRIHPFDRALYYRYRIAKQKGQDQLALDFLLECARLLPSDPAQRNDTATDTMKELKEEAQRQGREDVLKEFRLE